MSVAAAERASGRMSEEGALFAAYAMYYNVTGTHDGVAKYTARFASSRISFTAHAQEPPQTRTHTSFS